MNERLTFNETEPLPAKLKKSRNGSINVALSFYNRVQKRRKLKAQLQQESGFVAKDSMEMLAKLEQMEDEL